MYGMNIEVKQNSIIVAYAKVLYILLYFLKLKSALIISKFIIIGVKIYLACMVQLAGQLILNIIKLKIHKTVVIIKIYIKFLLSIFLFISKLIIDRIEIIIIIIFVILFTFNNNSNLLSYSLSTENVADDFIT